MREPITLIVNRRAIAAGLAALVSAPAAAAQVLRQLQNVPLEFDTANFAGMMKDGLFLPDYRFPMSRLVFDDGGTTSWNRYTSGPRQAGVSYSGGLHNPARETHAVAIETCAPDKNGMPRYAQLAIA